jgi:CHAT domain-containing protein/tetratricopeptide (TPR) repeat protein
MVLFAEAAEVFRARSAWGSYLYCLNGIGENLIRTARYAEARPILARADSVARAALGGRDPALVRTLHLRGYLALYEGDSQAALSLFQEAIQITREIAPADTMGLASSLQMLGMAEMRLGEYRHAEETLRSALQLLEAPGFTSLRNTILQALARTIMAQGDYASARKSLLELRSAGSSDPGFMIGVLQELSDAEYELGEFSSSLHYGEEALARSRQLYGDRHPITVSQIARLGDLQARAGQYPQAILYLTQAIELYKEIEGAGTWALGSLYHRLANAYREQGDLDSARECAEKGLALAEAANGKDHPGNAALHESLAQTYLSLGKASAALDHAARALELYRSAASGQSLDLAHAFTLLASVHGRLGEHGAALALADSAIELYGPASPGPGVAEAWRKRAEAHMGLGEPAKAKECFGQALATLGVEDPEHGSDSRPWLDLYTGREAVQSLIGYAHAGQQLFEKDPSAIRELKAAYDASCQATEILADMRARYLSEQPKLDLAVYGQPAFGQALRLALQMNQVTGDASYLREAYSLAEASKAGALIDAVVRAAGAGFGGIPAEVLEREKQLKHELFACDRRIQSPGGAPDSPSAPALLSRRFELQRELDQLLASYASTYAEFSGLARRPMPITAAGTMGLLDERTVLVEYCLLDEALVAFLVSSEGFSCVRVAIPADFQESVMRYCESLRTFDVASYREQARKLGSVLIDPLERAIHAKERLLVVPCDYLWYLPFETLLTARKTRGGAQDFTTLPYLLTEHEVTYLYSATFLREIEARPVSAERSSAFAGFAPGFGELGEGPFAQALLPADAGGRVRYGASGDDFRSRAFGELPQAGMEVSTIAEDFSRQNYRQSTFLGGDATEASFKQRASEFGYLHIASHSFVDERNPALTGILFSSAGQSGEDGVLHAGEMFDLRLQAALVVLSSCESGLGKMVPGEGLLAMTRGLFWSGAQNVMVSLWDVYDVHASELMVRFYPELLRGNTITTSLREAKLAMIANPRTAFPGKWGGFVHLGMD